MTKFRWSTTVMAMAGMVLAAVAGTASTTIHNGFVSAIRDRTVDDTDVSVLLISLHR